MREILRIAHSVRMSTEDTELAAVVIIEFMRYKVKSEYVLRNAVLPK